MRRAVQKPEAEDQEEFETSEFMDETDLDFVDTEYILEETSVPEKNARYALTKFVEDGPVSVEDFHEALEGASEVWAEYLEKEDHNPRDISNREAYAFGAGAADPGFVTNSPRYSEEVESTVETYSREIEESLGSEYGTATARKLAKALTGPEEIAEAEMKIRE